VSARRAPARRTDDPVRPGQRYEKPGVEAAIDKYLGLAKEFGLDPAQMALAFVTSRPFVTSNIIGATTMEQLRTDLDSVHLKLSPDVEKRIDALHQERGNLAP
jgi:aryl-alcohol dehydrogenase-like predicted oxidoreductase